MFIACWEAVPGADNYRRRKEVFACINCTMAGLQFVRVSTSYIIKFDDKKN